MKIGHKKVPRMQHKNKKWGTNKITLRDQDDKLEISCLDNQNCIWTKRWEQEKYLKTNKNYTELI